MPIENLPLDELYMQRRNRAQTQGIWNENAADRSLGAKGPDCSFATAQGDKVIIAD